MKRTLYILAALAILAGCNANEPEQKEVLSMQTVLEQPEKAAAPTPASEPPKPFETTAEAPAQLEPAKSELSGKLGGAIKGFDEAYGTNTGSSEFANYQDGKIQPWFIDEKAAKIRISFEVTPGQRVPAEKAWDEATRYTPTDAKEIGDIESGRDHRQ